MTQQITNAAEMARSRGVNGKRYRAILRKNLSNQHTVGSWSVVVGSEKHHLMLHELDAMVAVSGTRACAEEAQDIQNQTWRD